MVIHSPCRIVPSDFKKMVSSASLLGAQREWGSVENRPVSSLVVSLSTALNWMPPPLCGVQVVGPSSQAIVAAQSPSGEGWWQEGHLIVRHYSKMENDVGVNK